MKSERIGSAWADKKERARSGDHIITRKLPAWVEERDGKLVLIPAAGGAVRRVYDLTRGGYGAASIAKKLNEDRVPGIGSTGTWSRSYVNKLLSDRRTLGEFQPCKRDGSPDGEPIEDYFPALVTENDWHAVRAASLSRRQTGKKASGGGAPNNLFAGLITDARDGGSYYAAQRVDGHREGRRGRRQWVLIPTKSALGQGTCVSFPMEAFERAVLSEMREIDPRELLETSRPERVHRPGVRAGDGRSGRGQTRTGAGSRRGRNPGTRARPGQEGGAPQGTGRRAGEQSCEGRQPGGAAAWGEGQTLIDALATARDERDARVRLRAALRRIVSRITLLAVGRGRTRLAFVKIDFTGTKSYRIYTIQYCPPKSNGKTTVPPSLRVVPGDVNLGTTWTVDARSVPAAPQIPIGR